MTSNCILLCDTWEKSTSGRTSVQYSVELVEGSGLCGVVRWVVIGDAGPVCKTDHHRRVLHIGLLDYISTL